MQKYDNDIIAYRPQKSIDYVREHEILCEIKEDLIEVIDKLNFYAQSGSVKDPALWRYMHLRTFVQRIHDIFAEYGFENLN